MSGKRYKRFYVSESENQLTIYDNEGLDDYYHLGNDERDVKGICKLLNEQQATINKLKSDIEETEISIKLFEEDIATKDKKIDEQQAIIKAKDEEILKLKKDMIILQKRIELYKKL